MTRKKTTDTSGYAETKHTSGNYSTVICRYVLTVREIGEYVSAMVWIGVI